MLLKIMGGLMCILSTSLFGFLLGREKTSRLEELRLLRKLLYQLRGEIRYGYTTLPEAMGQLGGRNPTIFSEFFLSLEEKLILFEGDSFYSVWKQEIEERLAKTSLSREDKQKLCTLGENLGYLDQEMQLRNIDLFLQNMEEEIREDSRSIKEKIRLYQLLGVLSGVFVTIMML